MKKLITLTKISILLFFTIIIFNLAIHSYALITPKFKLNTTNNIIYYDNKDNEIFTNNSYTKLNEIPDYLKEAIISIEDKNFYNHNGFDFLRIIKAMITNIIHNDILEGASTISQQYIKNLYLTFDKTWERKIEEAYLTIELETHYTKDEILEGYLNTIDFGSGTYGITEASEYYFNKKPKDLTIEEATILVGIPKNPSYYNPITNYKNAKKRQKEVLNSMVKNKYINKNDIDDIYNKELSFYAKHNKNELSSLYYYKDAVLNELYNINEIPKSLLNMNGLKIYTNLDINSQKTLEQNIDKEMKNTTMQVASIIIEPTTGKIISLIGGKDYSKSQFNRVTSSKRQVGSTIKPFLYYAALENGFNASSTFLSERTTFNLGNELYSPKNANNIYANKNISMLSAIAYSDNIYAMKTHLFLGMETLSNISKRVKIKTKVNEVASSALGTSEINMLDYSNGFITLANEGVHNTPHIIEKITDNNNNILYEYKYKEEQILDKKYVFILNNLLTSTYNYKMVNYTSPTLLNIKNDINGKYAIKSGSTKTDYWTIGYNKDYLIMVWTGNDNNNDVKSNESQISKKIWSKTMNKIDKTKSWYDIPYKITAKTIDPISGNISNNGILCYFEEGSEPNYINTQ